MNTGRGLTSITFATIALTVAVLVMQAAAWAGQEQTQAISMLGEGKGGGEYAMGRPTLPAVPAVVSVGPTPVRVLLVPHTADYNGPIPPLWMVAQWQRTRGLIDVSELQAGGSEQASPDIKSAKSWWWVFGGLAAHGIGTALDGLSSWDRIELNPLLQEKSGLHQGRFYHRAAWLKAAEFGGGGAGSIIAGYIWPNLRMHIGIGQMAAGGVFGGLAGYNESTRGAPKTSGKGTPMSK